jgi:Uma2 family endonuclease
MASATQSVTDADLLALPRDGRKYELVDGVIHMSPAGYRHGRVIVRLSRRLDAYATEHALGDVLDSSTGFRLASGNVRSPDVSFVSAARVPTGEPAGFAEFPPDLAVEVLSPDDRPRDVLDKIGEYLGAGVRLVWIIDPEKATAVVYRTVTDVRRVEPGGILDGEDVVPGFVCPLSEILR